MNYGVFSYPGEGDVNLGNRPFSFSVRILTNQNLFLLRMWGWVNHEYHENLAILNSIDSTVLCGFVQIHFTDVHLSDDYCLMV